MPYNAFDTTHQNLACQSAADLTSRPTNALSDGEVATIPSLGVPGKADEYIYNSKSVAAFVPAGPGVGIIGANGNTSNVAVAGRWYYQRTTG